MRKHPPFRDAVVLLTTHVSEHKIEQIKREMAPLSKQAVRNALGRPRRSDPPEKDN